MISQYIPNIKYMLDYSVSRTFDRQNFSFYNIEVRHTKFVKYRSVYQNFGYSLHFW